MLGMGNEVDLHTPHWHSKMLDRAGVDAVSARQPPLARLIPPVATRGSVDRDFDQRHSARPSDVHCARKAGIEAVNRAQDLEWLLGIGELRAA